MKKRCFCNEAQTVTDRNVALLIMAKVRVRVRASSAKLLEF